jgi:DNA-binding transcriptional ArsR family regulator
MENPETESKNNIKKNENANAEDFFMRHVCDRSQKITEALYRITDLFPDEEPLKWILRNKAVDVFHLAIFTKNEPFHQRVLAIDKISSGIYRIIHLLEVAQATSFISRLNFEVIKREYLALRDFIFDKKDAALLQRQIFLLDKNFKRHIDNGQKDIGHNVMSDKETSVKKNKEKANQYSFSNNSVIKKSGSEKKDFAFFRKNKIIEFIKSKKDLSANIGELNAIFDKVSGKTIQRDLKKLVKAGILTEQGDKRWRKYILVY